MLLAFRAGHRIPATALVGDGQNTKAYKGAEATVGDAKQLRKAWEESVVENWGATRSLYKYIFIY